VIAIFLALVPACSGGHHRDRPESRGGGNGNGGRTSGPPPSPQGSQALFPEASPSCQPGVNAAEFWMISGNELRRLEAVAPGQVRYAFKHENLFVLGKPGQIVQVGQAVAVFQSYAALRNAITAHRIAPTTHWVMYDNERWPATTPNEQKHPWRYEALFAALAHRHGYRVILAPGEDLVFSFGQSRPPPAAPTWRRYLSLHLPAVSARAADIYEIQAQGNENPMFRQSAFFRRFVQAAVAQARAANPHVAIFAGLSTDRAGTAQMVHDFLAVRDLVAGYWLNVPHPDQRIAQQRAQQFLGSLPAGAAATGRTCAGQPPR
jgi:hypothetical protein